MNKCPAMALFQKYTNLLFDRIELVVCNRVEE